MAYFDSSKNRALWEIELQALRKEKAERAAGKVVSTQQNERKKQSAYREPERITYRELLEEEAAAMKKGPRREAAAKEAARERSMKEVSQKESSMTEVNPRRKEALAYEKV